MLPDHVIIKARNPSPAPRPPTPLSALEGEPMGSVFVSLFQAAPNPPPAGSSCWLFGQRGPGRSLEALALLPSPRRVPTLPCIWEARPCTG